MMVAAEAGLFGRYRPELPTISSGLRRLPRFLGPLQDRPLQRGRPPQRRGVKELALPVIVLPHLVSPEHARGNVSQTVGHYRIFDVTIFGGNILHAGLPALAGVKRS